MSDTQKHNKSNVPNKREQNQTCLSSAEREGLRPKGNVPNLRFPEFCEEWEKTTIGELSTIVGGGTPDTNNKDYWNGDVQWYTPSEVGKYKYVSKSLRTITKKGLKNSSARLLPPRSILLSSRATVGECSINIQECCTNQGFQSAIPNIQKVSTEFLYYRLLTHKREFIKKACGSTFLEISAKQISRLNTFVPTYQEQNKIASLLSLIDDRIEIQNKVIEDLISLEKVFINSTFREIKGEKIPLSAISERIVDRNADCSCSNVLTISAKDGLVSQLNYFKKSVASQNLSNYYLLQKGDFAYNKSYSTDYPWGAIKHLETYNQGILSPLYFCFRVNSEKINIDYLQLFFDTNIWYKYISEIAVEGARNHGLLNMSVSDFMAMPIPLPALSEQNKIVNNLMYLRKKRIREIQYLKALEKQKKFLLSQLFI